MKNEPVTLTLASNTPAFPVGVSNTFGLRYTWKSGGVAQVIVAGEVIGTVGPEHATFDVSPTESGWKTALCAWASGEIATVEISEVRP